MTILSPLQIALRQSRARPTVASRSIAGLGSGIAGPSKTVVERAPTGTAVQYAQGQSGLETPDDLGGGGVAADAVSLNGRG